MKTPMEEDYNKMKSIADQFRILTQYWKEKYESLVDVINSPEKSSLPHSTGESTNYPDSRTPKERGDKPEDFNLDGEVVKNGVMGHIFPSPEKKYSDGCIVKDNIGKGHTFLPGCEKYNPTAGFGKPDIAHSPKEEWRHDLQSIFESNHMPPEWRYEEIKSLIRNLLSQAISDTKARVIKGAVYVLKHNNVDDESEEYFRDLLNDQLK